MNIEIAKKEAPFSKLYGVFAIIPKTSYGVRIFPTKIEFYTKNHKSLEVFLDLKGPFKDFAVFLNVEKELIEVFGFSKDGFFRYRIFSEGTVKIAFDKTPKKFFLNINGALAEAKGPIDLPFESSVYNTFNERLSLGASKAQDMEMIARREDLKEILPLWFAIGKMARPEQMKYEGTSSLLLQAEREIQNKEKLKLEETFLNIYKIGFKGIFYPTLFDEKFQGIIDMDAAVSKDADALILLKKGYELIRRMFFQGEGDVLHILPCLLPSFHSGRMINLKHGSFKIDFEWSKKILKKMILCSSEPQKIQLSLQRDIKTFRVRKKKNEKGIFYKREDFLEINPNVNYLLDSFCK